MGSLLLPKLIANLVSRLSSALSAKASALRSFLLGPLDTIALISDGFVAWFVSLLLVAFATPRFRLYLRLTYS